MSSIESRMIIGQYVPDPGGENAKLDYDDAGKSSISGGTERFLNDHF